MALWCRNVVVKSSDKWSKTLYLFGNMQIHSWLPKPLILVQFRVGVPAKEKAKKPQKT